MRFSFQHVNSLSSLKYSWQADCFFFIVIHTNFLIELILQTFNNWISFIVMAYWHKQKSTLLFGFCDCSVISSRLYWTRGETLAIALSISYTKRNHKWRAQVRSGGKKSCKKEWSVEWKTIFCFWFNKQCFVMHFY